MRRPRPRHLLLAAVATVTAGCGSSASTTPATGRPPTSVTGTSASTSTVGAPTPSASSPASPGPSTAASGQLSVTFAAATAMSGSSLAKLAAATQTALVAAGFDATATTNGDRRIVVHVNHAGHAQRDQVIAASGLVDASSILLRPVLQCVAGAAQSLPTIGPGGSTMPSTVPEPTTSSVADPAMSALLPFAAGGGQCSVGPAGGTGTVFQADAEAAIINGTWGVTVTLRPGPDGLGVWNTLSAACYAGDATCPSRQLAIVVNGEVVSAPTVNQPSFDTGNVQITGSFSEADARALARVVNAGSLPVRFVVESVDTAG